ncbi:MAG: 2-hydroxyacyl-CoA dehydratase [Chloroflexota bacterium]|nr:MAG: 2-hydroxyacyl-CoA dehydratase [Chloroflexota bacterium]
MGDVPTPEDMQEIEVSVRRSEEAMGETLRTMEEVRSINGSFPFTAPMRRWKEKGKHIMGWGCSYVPSEILSAAGLLPIRVTGDAREIPTDEGDAYLYTAMCSYSRTLLQLGIDGQYDFLDGFVTTSSCDGMRRLVDMWRHYVVQTPLLHILTLPRHATAAAEQLFYEELQAFRKKLEEHFGVAIIDEALREAIHVQNQTRQLLKELYELRKEPNPPISGAETFEAVNAGVRMPRDEYNDLLIRLLQEARARTIEGPPKIRLMLSGSNLSNPAFIAGIEDQGAAVVIDDLCTGARYWSDPVDEDPGLDPMRALAHRYLNNLPCARTVGLADIRHARMLGLAREYRVQGLVNAVIRNCAPNGMDRPPLREEFEDAGIPVLELETEYGSGRTGMVATRVQAFLEMLYAQAAT